MESENEEFIEYEIEVVDSSAPANEETCAAAAQAAEERLPTPSRELSESPLAGQEVQPATRQQRATGAETPPPPPNPAASGQSAKLLEEERREESNIAQRVEGWAAERPADGKEKVRPPEERASRADEREKKTKPKKKKKEKQQVERRPETATAEPPATAATAATADQPNKPSINDAAIAVSSQERAQARGAEEAPASVLSSLPAAAAAGAQTTTCANEPIGLAEPIEGNSIARVANSCGSTSNDLSSAVAGKANQIPLDEGASKREGEGEGEGGGGEAACEVSAKSPVESPTSDRNDLTEDDPANHNKNNNEQEPVESSVSKDACEPNSADRVVIGSREAEDSTGCEQRTEIVVTTAAKEQQLPVNSGESPRVPAPASTSDEVLELQALSSNEEEQPVVAPPAAAARDQQAEETNSKAGEREGQPVVEQAEVALVAAQWRFVREPCQMQIEQAQRAERLDRPESHWASGELKRIETAAAAAQKEEEEEQQQQRQQQIAGNHNEDDDQDDDDDDPKRVSISIESADGEQVAFELATKFAATMTPPVDGDDTGSEDLEWEFDNEPAFEKRQVVIKRNCNPRSEYELGDELGRGKFGTVYRCVEHSSGRKLAAKFVLMRRREDREDVEREIDIMSCLQHKRLLQLYDAFDDGQSEMCLITELVEGGELFERIIDDDFELTEKKAAIFMRQICEGIEYMHSQLIVHLDMKPENILCLSKTGNRIKLIDFGLARKLVAGEQLRVMFGTPDFAAPEVLSYDVVTPATDMWSIGVICYVLLSGLSPFMGDNDMETMANVTRATYDFEDSAFEPISDLAKDFIAKLLVREPAKRLKPSECLRHDWLQRGGRQLEAAVRRASIAMLVSSGGLLEHQLASLSTAAAAAAAAAATATATAGPITPTTSPTSVPLMPPTGVQFASSSNLDVKFAESALMLLGGANAPASLFSLDKRNLKKYVVRRKWHKTVHAIMALGRMGANLKLRLAG